MIGIEYILAAIVEEDVDGMGLILLMVTVVFQGLLLKWFIKKDVDDLDGQSDVPMGISAYATMGTFIGTCLFILLFILNELPSNFLEQVYSFGLFEWVLFTPFFYYLAIRKRGKSQKVITHKTIYWVLIHLVVGFYYLR